MHVQNVAAHHGIAFVGISERQAATYWAGRTIEWMATQLTETMQTIVHS